MLRLSILASLTTLLLASCQKETAVEAANREGVFLMGNGSEPLALDLHLISGVPEGKIITALYEGLVADHPSGDDIMVPGAAASWTHNDELTEWTFKLQPDGKWSDGKPVTAHDFVFSYHRLLSPNLAASYAELLYPIRNGETYNQNKRGEILFRINPQDGLSWKNLKEINFRGDPGIDKEGLSSSDWDGFSDEEKESFVLGNGLDLLKKEQLEWIAGSPATRFTWPEGFDQQEALLAVMIRLCAQDLWDLAKPGVEAIDDLTLHLTLRDPVPFLPSLTRHYTWFPAPSHVILKFGKIDDRFTEWTKVDNLVGNGAFKITKWRYHDVIEVDRNPHYWDAQNVHLNGIHFYPIENHYTEARAYLAGQLHSTYVLPADLIRWARDNYPESLKQEPYVGTSYIRLNTKRPALSDPRVRKALALSIDRDQICEFIQEGYTPAGAFTPPMGSYAPTPVLSFDPEKGRNLLAEAGYPDGKGFPRYSLLTSNPKNRSAAEAFQAMWKEHLGIIIDITSLDWGSYITAQQNLDYDLVSASWIGDYLDPTTFLNMWTTGNGNNRTGWGSGEYDSLISQAAREADPAKRLDFLKSAEELLMNEQPNIPISHHSRNYLHRPEVKGWHPLLLDNHPWKAIRLEP